MMFSADRVRLGVHLNIEDLLGACCGQTSVHEGASWMFTWHVGSNLE